MPDMVSGDDLMVLRAAIVEDVHGFLDARVNSIRIKAVLGEQQLRIAMRHDAVGNAHANDADLVLKSVFFQQLEDGRAESTGQVSFFYGYNQALGARQGQQ